MNTKRKTAKQKAQGKRTPTATPKKTTPTAKKIFERYDLLLEPYREALKTASGLTDAQARLLVVYAIATHKDFDPIPILDFNAPFGWGKSSTMKQHSKICKGSKEISGETKPSLRDELNNCRTAFIDEADEKLEKSEGIIRDRWSKSTGKVTYKDIPHGRWQNIEVNTFGATVLATRKPLSDIALRSRCIVVKMEYLPGNYHPVDVDYEEFVRVVDMIKPKEIGSRGRMQDTWKPIMSIAFAIQDVILLDWCLGEMDKERKVFNENQEFDLTEACVGLLDALARDVLGVRVKKPTYIRLNKVSEALVDHFSLHQKPIQIKEVYVQQGYKVTKYQGLPAVLVDPSKLPPEDATDVIK